MGVAVTPRERNLSDIGLIALRYGLTRQDVLGSSRAKKVIEVRQECAAFLHRTMSHSAIGRLMGRHPSTILHSIAAHRKRSFRLPVNAGTTAGLI
jgi:chromosomal replication initiation ATPase DnaA